MADAMTQFKLTADEHMARDIGTSGTWTCDCEPCRNIRSLIGLDKVLAIRPLIRELNDLKERIARLPECVERGQLVERSMRLQDRLAAEMAK